MPSWGVDSVLPEHLLLLQRIGFNSQHTHQAVTPVILGCDTYNPVVLVMTSLELMDTCTHMHIHPNIHIT